MDVSEVKTKTETLEANIWKMIYEFEKETDVHVLDIDISRITNLGHRNGVLYQVHVDIGL